MQNRSSKKQQQLLEFIDDFIKQLGYGPSYREIMSGLGYKSVSTVAVHVNGLLAKGYIRKKDNSARSIEIVSLRSNDTVPSTPAAAAVQREVAKPEGAVDLVQLLVKKIVALREGVLPAEDEVTLLRALELVGGETEAAKLRSVPKTTDIA